MLVPVYTLFIGLLVTAQLMEIAYLCCVCWDSVSSFPDYDWSQLHTGIAHLAFQASDLTTACWDSLSIVLHAEIACLTSLASDWLTACMDSLVALSMLR